MTKSEAFSVDIYVTDQGEKNFVTNYILGLQNVQENKTAPNGTDVAAKKGTGEEKTGRRPPFRTATSPSSLLHPPFLLHLHDQQCVVEQFYHEPLIVISF